MIKIYDKIRLKTGEVGYIVEVLEDGEAYIADIDYKEGTDTVTIFQKDISEVIDNNISVKKAI